MKIKKLKLRSITKIRNEIFNKIDNCQKIKRYVKYLTDVPLEKIGYDKLDKEIIQNDIKESLINSNIFYTDFNENILDSEKVMLFIHRLQGNFDEEYIGEHILCIDIVTPYDYLGLQGQNTDRNIEIGYLIEELIDNEVINSIGKVILDGYKENTLQKSGNYNILTLFFKVKNLNKTTN